MVNGQNRINLLDNGGFEDGLLNWSGIATANIDTTTVDWGGQALHFTAAGEAHSLPIAVSSDQTYTLVVHYRWDSYGTNGWGYDRIRVTNADGSLAAGLDHLQTVYATPHVWNEIRLSIHPSGSWIQVSLGQYGTRDGVSISFDDALLTAGDYAFQPSVTPTPGPVQPAGETWTYYYYAGSERIAMYTWGSNESPVFLFGDHLGSTSLAVKFDGTEWKAMRQLYKPWGETRYSTTDSLPTDYHFTGQKEMEFGIYDYGARWYDPSIGRFLQADTIIPEASQGVQAWDRYAYVNNSPIMHSDPSGHCITDPFSFVGCVLIAAAIVEAVLPAVEESLPALEEAAPQLAEVAGPIIDKINTETAPIAEKLTNETYETMESVLNPVEDMIHGQVEPAEGETSSALESQRPDLYRTGNTKTPRLDNVRINRPGGQEPDVT
jgi:RHS repeat-associated protein